MKVMNKMFKSHSSTQKDDSDSESEASADGWKKGVNLEYYKVPKTNDLWRQESCPM